MQTFDAVLAASAGVKITTASAAIFAVIAAGVVAIVLIRNWQRRWALQDERVPHRLLSAFRELHAKGELSSEEFERLRRRLTPQIQQTEEGTTSADDATGTSGES